MKSWGFKNENGQVPHNLNVLKELYVIDSK